MKIDLKSMGIGLAASAAAAWLYELYDKCFAVVMAASIPSGVVSGSTVIGRSPLYIQCSAAQGFVVAL